MFGAKDVRKQIEPQIELQESNLNIFESILDDHQFKLGLLFSEYKLSFSLNRFLKNKRPDLTSDKQTSRLYFNSTDNDCIKFQ